MKTKLLDLLETSPNSNKSNNKSSKGSSQSQTEEQLLWLYPGKGSTSKQKKPTTPDLSSKLGKEGS